MDAFPIQVLRGVYLGLLTGLVPALVAWGLGFLFKYLTDVSIPGFGVVVLALAIAGVNGGLLALNDPTVRASENQTAVVVAILVVLMLSLYAHAMGDRMGASMPKHLTLKRLTERTLSTDVVELVGGRGEVTVTVTGGVGDVEGYPPLPADLRAELRDLELTFPADLPLAELESRVADRLRSDYDLPEVEVRLDERARATVTAAAPLAGLSKRVPSGKRAVSVSALVPTGLARGDEVTVVTVDSPSPTGAEGDGVDGVGPGDDGETPAAPEQTVTTVTGTVVSLASGKAEKPAEPSTDAVADGGEGAPSPAPSAPTASGGRGRVTVAVNRADATALVGRDAHRLVVRSRGHRREFELISLLRRAGKRFGKLTVREGGLLDGTSLRAAAVRDDHDVVVLAVRVDGEWHLAPDGSVTPTAGSELFVVGTRDAIEAFRGETA